MTSYLSVDEEVRKLTSYFTAQSFNITNEWLYGCVQYFRTENPRCSESEMRDCVTKQWELSDLRDSSSGCLPRNLNSHQKITLRGKYVLQIESVINIGMSAYSQIQKIRKVDIENVELTEKKPEAWEPKSKRMLKINLCDGPNIAEAIEYRPLPMLFEQITPGTKIMIIGPVDCRRGCFFLKPQNLKIIGGEVDSMLITNYMENVLARILNLPENEDPYSNQNPLPVAPRRNTSEVTSQNNAAAHTASTNVEIPPRRSANQMSTNVSTRTAQNYHTNNAPTNSKRETHFPDVVDEIVDLDVSGWEDDDLFADESALLQIEEAHTSSSKVTQASSTSANSEFVCNGNTMNKRKTLSGNSDIAVPPKVPKTVANESNSRTTNIHNSFLATDEYVDAMLELEEEEIYEVSSGITTLNTHSNTYEYELKSTTSGSAASTASKERTHSNYSSRSNELHNSRNEVLKNPKKLDLQNKNQNPLFSSKDQQFNKKSDSIIPQQSKIQFSSNTSGGQQLFKTPCTVTAGQSRNASIANWCKKNSVSSQSSTTGMYQMSSNSTVGMKESKFNPSVNNSKFSGSSKASPPLPNPVSNEEDWADAYFNTSNLSFINKFNDVDDIEAISSKATKQSSFSGSRNKSSELKDPKKQSSPLPTHNDRFKIPDNKVTEKTRSPIQKSQVHLPAAFCSPNDSNDNVDVTLIPSYGSSMEASDFTNFPTTSTSSFSAHSSSEKTKRTGVENSVQKWTCPIKTSDPFQYLIHVLHSRPKNYGIHKFKATILTLLSQLSINAEGEWTLKAKIGDGSGSLDVQFSSDVLEEIIGLSPQEFKQMKKEVPKNPVMKEKLRQVLKNSQQKFVDLNCIFSIRFEEDKMATVIKLCEVTPQDVNKLKLRLLSK